MRIAIISTLLTAALLAAAASAFAPLPLLSARHSSSSSPSPSSSSLDLQRSSPGDPPVSNTDGPGPGPGPGPAWGGIIDRAARGAAATLLATTLAFNAFLSPLPIEPAHATDAEGSKQIVSCLLTKCPVPFAKCITNPKCMANVICINTCNSAADETGCQIKCGDIFENDVVGEFNKCAVSDMSCVPQKQDDGSYPIPTAAQVVPKFDTKLWNGRWYITAGQNPLFDIFPCQVHFFTETAPGKFFGKLNWRIEEPDGEFFNRDAIQAFTQDPKMPAHLINHDNEYLHYEDDWYIIDYAEDGNKEGIPPFALVYYIGNNDAWRGYGGAVVYTRDAKLPESLRPRLREAAKKVNFDFDRDFAVTDNSCGTQKAGEKLVLREKFAGKVAIQTERQLQAEATMAARMATNTAKAQKLFVAGEISQVEKAVVELERNAVAFEKEIAADVVGVEKAVEQVVEKEVETILGGGKKP